MHIRKSVNHIGNTEVLPTGSWHGNCAWQNWLFIVLVLEVLGRGCRASCMLGIFCTTKLHLLPGYLDSEGKNTLLFPVK